MALIKSFRLHFFLKKLSKILAAQTRKRKVHNLWTARNVGILFDATAEKDRSEIQNFAKALEKEGRKVRLLGFVNDKKNLPETLPFDFFSPKQTAWPGLPKTEKAESFSGERFDLLLVVNSAGRLPLEWIAAKSAAAMKIGSATNNPNDFDIMLETPPGKGVPFFLEQLDLYLDKIAVTHELSFAKV